MERKELEIGSPVSAAGVTVIPVSEVSVDHWHSKNGVLFFGVKQPVSIAVLSPSAKMAFRVTGEELGLEQLIQEVPGIKEVLEEM